jgi:hypothetical protein
MPTLMTCGSCRLNGKHGYVAGSAVAFMNLTLRQHVFANACITALETGTFAGPGFLGSSAKERLRAPQAFFRPTMSSSLRAEVALFIDIASE